MTRNDTPSTAAPVATKRQSNSAAAVESALEPRLRLASHPSAARVASEAAMYGMKVGESPLLAGASTTARGITTKIATNPSTTSEAAAMSSVRRTWLGRRCRLLCDPCHGARERLGLGVEHGRHGLWTEAILG